MQTIKIAAAFLLLILFSATVASAQTDPKVNINTATEAELQYLPRIGPATADNILFARESGFVFKTCKDLQRVNRIGEKTAAGICPHVVFTGPTTATGKLGSTASGSTASAVKFKRPDPEDAP